MIVPQAVPSLQLGLRPRRLCNNSFIARKQRKKGRDLTKSYDKNLHAIWKLKRSSNNTKSPPKHLITQRLRTTAIQLVWSNRFMGSQHSPSPQKQCNEKDTHSSFYDRVVVFVPKHTYMNLVRVLYYTRLITILTIIGKWKVVVPPPWHRAM